MNRDEVLSAAGDLNANTFYWRADCELITISDIRSIGPSAISAPLIVLARKLRQRLINVYDFGPLQDPPIVTPEDTVLQQLEREESLGKDYGLAALDAVCDAVNHCKIKFEALLKNPEDWTPQELMSLSSTSQWFIMHSRIERGEVPGNPRLSYKS